MLSSSGSDLPHAFAKLLPGAREHHVRWKLNIGVLDDTSTLPEYLRQVNFPRLPRVRWMLQQKHLEAGDTLLREPVISSSGASSAFETSNYHLIQLPVLPEPGLPLTLI